MPSIPRTRPSWWEVTWRYGLCWLWWLGMIGVLALSATLPDEPEAARRILWWAIDLPLGAAMILAMRWRHRQPLLLAWTLVILGPLSASGGLAVAWAFIHVCTSRRWRQVLPLAVGMVAATVLTEFMSGWGFGALSNPRPRTAVDLVFVMVFADLATAALAAIGFYVGARRDLMASLVDRAETAEREQESRILQAQAEERNRIAREMHDVLAHRLSLVSMHAGALAFREDLSPEQVRETAAVIQENAHASLGDLRGILTQLRAVTDTDGAPERPQPTWQDLPGLFAEARAAGANLNVIDRVERPETLPVTTGRHAYRVVQEALTNARKHAPDVRQVLELSGAPGEGLTIVARNPLRAGRSSVPGAGLGLVGLAERAQVAGGWLTKSQDNGQFEVKVWLPW